MQASQQMKSKTHCASPDISSNKASPEVSLESRAASANALEYVGGIVAVAEAILFALASLCMAMLFVKDLADRVPEYAIVTAMSTLALTIAFYMVRLYSLRALSMPARRLPRIFMVFGGLLLAVTSIFFALKVSSDFSRAWLFSWLLVGFCLIAGLRLILGRLFERWADTGIFRRDVVILGAGDRGRSLLKEISEHQVPRVRVVGFFDDRVERYGDSVEGVPLLGKVSDLVDYLRSNPVAEIMITLPWSATDRIQSVTRELGMLPVDVSLIPDSVISEFRAVRFGRLGNVPILQVSRVPISGWKFVFKWLEDRLGGGLIAICVAPVMLIIAAAIKLTSPGPVFFRQDRYGFNNKLIAVYKFRTMYTHLTDANAERLTSKNDERVTPLGRILRRTSLDELPQLLNVLKGEMSLVGPRPHATAAKAGDMLYQDVAADYAARHRVKPGITGWAQVNGWRGETDTHEKLTKRVEHDLYYIDNYSLYMDLRILLKTVLTVVNQDNAH